MADRYWVQGGTGNWNSTTNWSAASGGASGAAVPTSVDNVYFDASSFTAVGQSVTISTAATCLDMDWTGSLFLPTLVHGSEQELRIHGSLTLTSSMQYLGSAGVIIFKPSATSKTVDFASIATNNIYFDGLSTDTWTLNSDISATNDIRLWGGTLDLNDYDVTCVRHFYTGGTTTTRVLTMGSGTLTCGYYSSSTLAGLTINRETSTIVCAGYAGSTSFNSPSGIAYYNIQAKADCDFLGSFSCNKLTLDAGRIYTLQSTHAITLSSFDISGTATNPITLQSSSSTLPALIYDTTGTNTFYYASIENITCYGGATFNAQYCIDNGGNTGITFVTAPAYEIIRFAERYYPNTGISQADLIRDVNMIHARVYNKIIRAKNIYKNTMVESVADQKSVALPSDCLPENIVYVTVSSDITGAIDANTTYQEYQLAHIKQDVSGGYWYKVTSSTTIDLTKDGVALDADDYNINFYYYATPQEITTPFVAIDLDSEYHDVLKYGLVQAMASQGHNPDTDIANYYQSKYDERMKEIEGLMDERKSFASVEPDILESRW